jgi:hypothetical protein
MPTANLVFVGSSITAGNHIPVGTNFPELIQVARPSYGFHNLGAGSAYIDNNGVGATADALVDGSTFNVLIAEWGINDMSPIAQNESAATFFANYKAWMQARTGFNRKVAWTALPVGGDATFNGRRATSNTSIRGDTSFYTTIADVAADPTIGTDAAGSNTLYYSDGTHPTQLCAGTSYIERIVLAAIDLAINGAPGSFASCFAGAVR